MAKLDHIVTQIADSLNRPIDAALKARIKELVIQEFAMFVSRSINKYGIDKEFVYSYTITEFTITNYINQKELTIPYLTTVNKIPRPLRYESDTPFVYVGLEEGNIPFAFRNFSSRQYTNLLPNVGLIPSYDFHEDRIRIWNAPIELMIPKLYDDPNPPDNIVAPTAKLLVQQVPADPRASSTPDVIQNIFDGDKEFPITQDMVQQIKLSLLKGELSVTDSKDKIEATHLENN